MHIYTTVLEVRSQFSMSISAHNWITYRLWKNTMVVLLHILFLILKENLRKVLAEFFNVTI